MTAQDAPPSFSAEIISLPVCCLLARRCCESGHRLSPWSCSFLRKYMSKRLKPKPALTDFTRQSGSTQRITGWLSNQNFWLSLDSRLLGVDKAAVDQIVSAESLPVTSCYSRRSSDFSLTSISWEGGSIFNPQSMLDGTQSCLFAASWSLLFVVWLQWNHWSGSRCERERKSHVITGEVVEHERPTACGVVRGW